MTTTQAATKRAVIYCRVSTSQQAGERNVSLETEEARARAYCESRGYRLGQVFVDVASGRKDDRPSYRRMLDHVLDGHADVVVVLWLDRFGRRPQEILTRYWQLQEQGVSVEATEEDIREELMLLIKAGIAGQESRRTSETEYA